MRFFKKEIWRAINCGTESIQKQAYNEWQTNCQNYEEHFTKIEDKLPKRFIRSFTKRNGFHDYNINNISIVKTPKNTYSCEMTLSKGKEVVILIMQHLTAVHIDIDSFQHLVQNNLFWGYCEFDITKDSIVQLNIICNIEHEFMFEFKTISLKIK